MKHLTTARNSMAGLLLLGMLGCWALPVQAERYYNERGQRVEQSKGSNYSGGKKGHVDNSARSSRRYPPRNGDSASQRGYKDSRGYENSYNGQNNYDKRRSTKHTPDAPAAQRGRQQGNGLDEAISRVRKHSDGRVLSAETVRNNNRDEYRVRVITDDGRVRRYRLDAKTGNMLPKTR